MSCEQDKAVVAQAILARHPALGDGLDAMPVDDGCMLVIGRWLAKLGVESIDGTVCFFEHQSEDDDPAVCLALDLQCTWLVLRGTVERAEAAAPGLGWTMLTLLDEMGWNMSLFTPYHVSGLAEYSMWGGNSSDAQFRNYLNEMEEEPLTDEQFAEHFKPSDYDNGFSDVRAVQREDRPRLRRPQIRRISEEHEDPWVRELAGVVLRISRLDDALYADMRRNSFFQPTEPMAVLYWEDEAPMQHPIDEWVNLQWQSGESEPFEFYLPVDTPENAAETIEQFEAGFERLKLFYRLAACIEKGTP